MAPAPVITQASSEIGPTPASADGRPNTPEPTMLPITSAVAIDSPSDRFSFGREVCSPVDTTDMTASFPSNVQDGDFPGELSASGGGPASGKGVLLAGKLRTRDARPSRMAPAGRCGIIVAMTVLGAIGDYGGSVRECAGMIGGHRLARPADNIGATLSFRDATSSRVFRETVAVGAVTGDPVLLVIAFRLVFLGRVAALHAVFRRECLIHTPL